MLVEYVARRFGVMLLVIFLAVSINFLIPRLMPGDPVEAQLSQLLAQGGGNVGDVAAMVDSYRARFGLDQPLWRQYIAYWVALGQGDLGFSLANYPERVLDAILGALPWTLGLLGAATAISFVLGTALGGLMGWPRASRFWRISGAGVLLLSSIPYFLIGMVLLYCFVIVWPIFPAGGGLPFGMTPGWNWATVQGIAWHGALPLASIVLAETGAWAIGMRGMIVSIVGDDHITLAEAKGLRRSRIFNRYAMRCAMLPQVTRLALAMASIVSGAILVEVIFSYPGIGFRLFQAVQSKDYFVIQGIVLMLTVTLAVATFILDLLYPLIDPRITHRRGG